MKLEPLLTFHAQVNPPSVVGAGPFGSRTIVIVTGGSFEGPRLRGKILPGGGDWLVFGPDGYGRIDVRMTFETDDGAYIYVTYVGVLEMNDRVLNALGQEKPAEYGDSYFFAQPRFETGDPRYAWLNQIVAVSQGRLVPHAVEYRVFALAND